MKKLPLVSILIPNYNYARTIREAIESAINQTYPKKEIIVLDNHSTDDSYKIAKEYRKYGVKVYRNKRNMGAHSHNRLICMSKGKYVHVLHSDDAILPTFIEECVNLMEKHPNVGFTVTERYEVDESSNPIPMAPPFYNTSCIIPAEQQKSVLLMASYYVPSQTVIRKEILERIGLYKIEITTFMDWWLLYECSSISDMGCINKPLCQYRVWKASDTNYMTKHMIMPLAGFLNRMSMIEIAREENDLPMLERETAAVYKQADLTLKLGVDVIRYGLMDTGRKYLSMAQAFSLDIIKSDLYIAIKKYLDESDKSGITIDEYLEQCGLSGKRNQSYDPPNGFIIYEDNIG